LGYEGDLGSDSFDYYVQGGPAFVNPDGVDGSTQFSSKLGANVAATEKLGVYGEVSYLSAETGDASYGTKLGAKYKF